MSTINLRYDQLLREIWNKIEIEKGSTLRDYLNLLNNSMIDGTKTIKISFDVNKDQAYTHLGKDHLTRRIVLGGLLVKQIALMQDRYTSKKAIKDNYGKIVMTIIGLDYHEMAHNLFTDMVSDLIINYPQIQYRGFLHILFNMVEDVVIEILIDKLFQLKFTNKTRPAVYFYHLKQALFAKQAENYEDKGTVDDFINYLLLVLRCGKDKVKGTNAIYEKYVDGFRPLLQAALRTVNATERLKKVIELGEWMIANIEELKFTMPTPRERRSGSLKDLEDTTDTGFGKGTLPPGDFRESDGKLDDSKPTDETPTAESSKPGEKTDTPSAGEGKSVKDSDKEDDTLSESKEKSEKGGKDDGSEAKEAEKTLSDLTDKLDEEIDELIEADESSILNTDLHEWVYAKDEFDINHEVVDILDNQIHEFSEEINTVANLLKLIKSRTKARYIGHYSSGKLDVKKVMSNKMHETPSTKVFKQKHGTSKANDLAIWLVGDNSGSMGGDKSTLCNQAMLVLAQACDWAGIPFCASVFTKTCDDPAGVSITIVEKKFEDNFDETKPYFAINDSRLKRYVSSEKDIPLFRGNSEEVNLYYIWQEFRKVKHDSKLLIVMCDGETTGSESTLRTVIDSIEKDGIGVIGVGIQCRAVRELYPKSKLFSTTQEIKENLPQFLIDTLTEYMLNN